VCTLWSSSLWQRVVFYVDTCVSEEHGHVLEVTVCWCHLQDCMMLQPDTHALNTRNLFFSLTAMRVSFHVLRRRTCVIGAVNELHFALQVSALMYLASPWSSWKPENLWMNSTTLQVVWAADVDSYLQATELKGLSVVWEQPVVLKLQVI